MPSLSHLEWLIRQAPPAEVAARLRLDVLRELARDWRGLAPARLDARPVFTALRDQSRLRAAFEAAGLTKALVKEAEAILAGDFALFGGFPLRVESDIPDWLAAFPHGGHWPIEYSFDIDISGRDGRDIRFTWELSRHASSAALARAFFLTGDSRYLARLEALLSDWVAKNAFLRGPNWISPLEVAMRAIAWTFADDAAGSALSSASFRDGLLAVLFSHGLYVDRFLSTGLNPSNHIIGEAAGLFVLGTKFRTTPQGRRWRARAVAVLEREIRRQTFASGVSREQSIAYHRFVTGLFALCAAVGGPLTFSERYREALRRMYGFLFAVARPDGSFPQLGDSDDATALRLSAPRPDDLRQDLALAAAIFPGSTVAAQFASTPERAVRGAGKPSRCPEVLWLLGPDASKTVDGSNLGVLRKSAPVPISHPESVLIPDAGLAILRSPDGGLQAEFDFGPQGYTPVSSHGHADALSLTLWHGRDRLVDSGAYRYNGADAWRNAFRTTAFHNTVTVDTYSQAVPASPFRWQTLADATPGGSFLSDDFDWVSGALAEGQFRPWSHTREVLRLGAGVLILIDLVESRGCHTANAYFHCGKASLSTDGRRATAEYPDGGSMRIFAVNSDARFQSLDHSKPVPAWRSPSYGMLEPSATFAASAAFEGRVTLPWIISLNGDFVTGTPEAVRNGFAAEMSVEGRRYLFTMPYKPDLVQVGDLRFIGRWALVEFAGNQLVRAWCAFPWALEYAGKRLFTQIGGQEFAAIVP